MMLIPPFKFYKYKKGESIMLFSGLNPIEQLQVAFVNLQFDMECHKAQREARRAGFNPDSTPTDDNQSNDNSSSTTESKPKTEEEKKAEAEAPSEPAGAEKIDPEPKKEPKVEAEAEPQSEAAMGGTTPKPEEKVNVHFDFSAMNGQGVQPNPTGVGQGQQPPVGPQGQPIYQQTPPATGSIPPEFIQNPMLYYQYLQQMQGQQPVYAPPGAGRHKVDNPPQVKNQPPKAEADNVQMDGLSQVHPAEVAPPPPAKEWPQAVSTPLVNPKNEPQHVEVKFDNTAITSKYPYMKEIEQIAIETGHQVQFIMRAGPDGNPDGMVTVVTFINGNPKPNPAKGFTVDTGMIIDRRPKMFPVIIPYGFENYPCYEINMSTPVSDNKKKGKAMPSRKMFEDFFKGGVQMLDGYRTMYTDNFRELNKLVSMITMPTNHMNKEIRKAVQGRLLKAMEAGVFHQATGGDASNRFMFTNFDPKTCTFVLSNVGVPICYDGPVVSSIPIEIHFMENSQTKIVRPKEA